jgi:hypothetical protein
VDLRPGRTRNRSPEADAKPAKASEADQFYTTLVGLRRTLSSIKSSRIATARYSVSIRLPPKRKRGRISHLPCPCPLCGARMIIIEASRAAASQSGSRPQAGSTRHDPDRLCTSPLYRSDAPAPRRRRSLAAQSRRSTRRSSAALASVSPSCSGWGTCWALPSTSSHVKVTARSSPSKFRWRRPGLAPPRRALGSPGTNWWRRAPRLARSVRLWNLPFPTIRLRLFQIYDFYGGRDRD